MKKGILKNKAAVVEPAVHAVPEGERGSPGGHLKWDEETIAAQDKERGGKMKITEPKTPYNYYDSVSAYCIIQTIGRGRRSEEDPASY